MGRNVCGRTYAALYESGNREKGSHEEGGEGPRNREKGCIPDVIVSKEEFLHRMFRQLDQAFGKNLFNLGIDQVELFLYTFNQNKNDDFLGRILKWQVYR